MPEGKEIGKAYVTVNLDDQTDADYQKIKTKLEGQRDVAISTKLDSPSAADYEKIKAEAKTKSVDIPAHVDNSQVKQAFREIADTIDSSSKQSQSAVAGMMSGAAAGWTALGALLSGPAVAGAMGVAEVGFAALGIAAEKSSPQVQQAFANMKTQGTDVLQSSFQSLTPTIVDGLNQWGTAALAMAPAFQRVSSEIAPGLGIINSALVQGAETAIPAFAGALNQATPMAHALAGGIGDVATGFSQFLGTLDFTQANAGLSSLMSDVGKLEPVFGQLLNSVMPLGNAILSGPVPAVISLAGHLADDLSPAIQGVAAGVQALSPVLNFMSGPAASIMVGVAAFKALESGTNALLPVFNSASSAVTNYGNKLISMAGGSDQAIGSFNLLTDAAKKQAVQAAASTLAAAQQTAAQATEALATLESAAASDAASVSQEQLAVARVAATAATAAETEATVALTAASEASSFAFAPVGIGLAAVAGAMTLFTSNTDKAAPAVTNFTQELQRLAQSAPSAAQGIIASDPKLAEFINKAQQAGVSVNQLTAALNQGGSAQQQIQAQLEGTISKLGSQNAGLQGTTASGKAAGEAVQQTSLTIADLSARVGDNADALKALSPQQQDAITKYRAAQTTLSDLASMFTQNATAQQAAAAVGAQATQLTSDQWQAASVMANQFGLSLSTVTSAFQQIPGAGSTATDSVMNMSSAFLKSEIAVKNAEQGVQDYFTHLQQSADQANQALSNANHSYQQSIQSVADAQHSYAQSQQAVVTADQGVVTAQHALADANQGVVTAENSLTRAQQSEQQAQQSLTQARKDAVQQLKDLQLQLNDQVTAEQRAQLQLFNQTQTSAALGVTPQNAQAILAQATTTSNVSQKQAALDLISAENSLADTLNTGAQLRDKVNTANAQGVNQNPQVVSAAQALSNAQDQVTQAVLGVQKAQQAVMNAQAGVVKAQQAVTDAVYNEQKARQGITDAIYNEQQALQAMRSAQQNATQANQLNTTSLDINTQAGRNNFAQLQTLFGAYPQWMSDADKFNQKIQDTAKYFGGSTQAASDFLKKEGEIPKDFQFGMTGFAYANFTELNRVYDQQFGGRIGPIAQNVAHAFAGGGHVKGPGGPKADAINARLSDGEYVQPADAVDHYGVGFMQAIQQKKFPKGGDGASAPSFAASLPGFASGGLVQAEEQNYFLSGTGAAYQTAVNALDVMGFPHPPALPAYAPPPPDTSGAISYAAGLGVAQWVPQILQALAALGQPASWLGTVERRMNQESGGDPNSVNRWDSNWLAGHPSQGLMQTIPSTFNAYRNPAWSANILDPLNNIYAGLNYALHRYGSLSALNQPGGYDSGGFMLDNLALNSTGKPEMVLPPKLTDTLMSLHEMVQSGQSTSGRGGVSVTNNITTVPMNPDEVAQVASRELSWALRHH